MNFTRAPSPYKVPPFAERIAHFAPATKINLSMRPTPVHTWNLHSAVPDIPPDIQFYIKRDDMTGAGTSGNKIRKLEFLIADAISKGCDTVITAGGVQSNHARATAVVAKELGLEAHVFLRTREHEHPEKLGSKGNVLFHRMLGVQVHLVRPVSYLAGLLPKMRLLQEKLAAEGKNAYLIGIGGSNEIGVWGYIDAFNELLTQGVREFTDIVVAVGSGGTASGLAIGNYLAGRPVRVHAVTVCDTPAYFYGHLNEMLAKLGLDQEVDAQDILHITEAKGLGYARSTEEELELGLQISRSTGIMLDPVYTLKAIYGMISELKKGKSPLRSSRRILFVHTGGVFGLFDGRIEPHLDSSLARTWRP
ncbi:putative D-cysteine desulfhydrase 1, mitochondrial [Gracilariopsis chorda]|uniref:Putative D-cysteine desulfhydrase 1, mitochondrial n=1 Tax=Gracilariopsis chorda TaxID=448386 RepID=A0A2V3IV86_9FLOR|nr:putative D-cysteine desulfhydrase 1, mitochondrial [Gracilariopsis chorda]|eukprot:PXF45617.1 putative D-cysteine desulfhydrase 1, mitochondrial [Gracilariopsis chorda]